MIVSANSCVDVVIDTKYIGNVAVETEVSISRVVLLLDEVKNAGIEEGDTVHIYDLDFEFWK